MAKRQRVSLEDTLELSQMAGTTERDLLPLRTELLELRRDAAVLAEVRCIVRGDHPRWALPPSSEALVRALLDECEARINAR